jgi:hypothetical protein
MSEAMSATEIEDVLSSIRRLVSEDLRPAAVAKAAAAESRLILTPALRVVPDPASEEVWEDEEDWTEAPAVEALGPSGWSLPEAEPEPAELDVPSAIPMQPASARTSMAEPAPDLPLPPHRFTLTQAARIAPEPAADPQPWDQPVDVIEHRSTGPKLVLERASAEQTVWADQAAAKLIAGLEADVAVEDPLEVISETDPAFLEDDLDLDEPAAPEVQYDEELLRALVRDILREELAGSLGEKITRNVRKLVRAEIAQALATRDLG